MKIKFLDDFDSKLRVTLTRKIESWQHEVNSLLPNNPEPRIVKFDNKYLIQGHGTGGFAGANNVLILAFQLDYPEKDRQLDRLRASYFHESYHIGQGWVGDVKINPISEAILEGAATVFERDKTNSQPEWSMYYAKNEMLKILNEVLKLKNNFDKNKWKYYDKKSGKSHLLYKVGTFIIDEALK